MTTNRQLRMNLRNFLLPASVDECWGEYDLSLDRDDLIRASIIQDLIIEWFPESYTRGD